MNQQSKLQRRIIAQNERAKDKLREFFGGHCFLGHWSDTCTIHHGLARSLSWYHMFSPKNWHWLGRDCHDIAENERDVYPGLLAAVRPDLYAFMVDPVHKIQSCSKSTHTMSMIEAWMDEAVKTNSYAELLAMPIWQVRFGIERVL